MLENRKLKSFQLQFDNEENVVKINFNKMLSEGGYYTTHGLRGIGKTTALLRFAKENNYAVLVKGGLRAYHLKKEGYNAIIVPHIQSYLNKNPSAKMVFDEGCFTAYEVECFTDELKSVIVAGFVDKY